MSDAAGRQGRPQTESGAAADSVGREDVLEDAGLAEHRDGASNTDPMSPAASTCSTAASPATYGTSSFRETDESGGDDDEEDEILRGLSLWNYSGPVLEDEEDEILRGKPLWNYCGPSLEDLLLAEAEERILGLDENASRPFYSTGCPTLLEALHPCYHLRWY